MFCMQLAMKYLVWTCDSQFLAHSCAVHIGVCAGDISPRISRNGFKILGHQAQLLDVSSRCIGPVKKRIFGGCGLLSWMLWACICGPKIERGIFKTGFIIWRCSACKESLEDVSVPPILPRKSSKSLSKLYYLFQEMGVWSTFTLSHSLAQHRHLYSRRLWLIPAQLYAACGPYNPNRCRFTFPTGCMLLCLNS